jgi:hypothetical protein
MFELFPDGPVYEYPQLVNITYSFIWAFVLSSIMAITHRVTFTGDHYPRNFFQSLILGSIVAAMIMMAIGDSLARGLGVFGAMAIIRFSTRIEDPRDVLFLFAALSTGLAIGVYGFTISFVGTVLFCVVALGLHYSPFRSIVLHHHVFFILEDKGALPKVEEALKRNCYDHRLVSIQKDKTNEMRYQYSIELKRETSKVVLMNELAPLEGIKQIKITINEVIKD